MRNQSLQGMPSGPLYSWSGNWLPLVLDTSSRMGLILAVHPLLRRVFRPAP